MLSFAKARDMAIRDVKFPDVAVPVLPEVPLPFAIEAGERKKRNLSGGSAKIHHKIPDYE